MFFHKNYSHLLISNMEILFLYNLLIIHISKISSSWMNKKRWMTLLKTKQNYLWFINQGHSSLTTFNIVITSIFVNIQIVKSIQPLALVLCQILSLQLLPFGFQVHLCKLPLLLSSNKCQCFSFACYQPCPHSNHHFQQWFIVANSCLPFCAMV